MEPPKVLVVMRSGTWRGGAEWSLWYLFEQSRTRNVRWIAVFLEDGDLAQDVRQLGIETHVIPAGRMRETQRGLSAAAALYRLLRREGVDLVIGWMADSHVYVAPVAAAARVPVLWYQHWIPKPGWLDRLATLLPARGVLAASQAIANSQQKIRPSRPIGVVHPAVDLRRFDPAELPSAHEARRRLSLPIDGPLVGIVGRIERWKGTHVLVEAMPAILERYPTAHCIVVGTVHERSVEYGEMLERRVEDLGIRPHVIFAGRQRNPEVWMSAMDVVVHASDAEPFGIVVLEGLAVGKPVVAGDAGGPTEVITPGENGLLTPYDDHEALAQAILSLLDDPDLAQRLGRAGRRRAADFSTERYAQTLLREAARLSGIAEIDA